MIVDDFKRFRDDGSLTSSDGILQFFVNKVQEITKIFWSAQVRDVTTPTVMLT